MNCLPFPRLTGVVLFLASVIAAPQLLAQSGSTSAGGKAVVPRLIRFGGVLKDAGAKPLHGVQDATFSLYREEASGEPLWFETQTVEADAQGRYSVLLGAMHPEGLPMALFTSGEARWLGVSVGRLPEQARVLLVAVPYALKAADADTLGGKPATAFVASDQLKDQVQSVVQAQTAQAGAAQGTRTLVGTAPTPQVIAETSPGTFTCATSGVCLQTSQSGAGGIALRGTTGSATGTAGIFDNLGGGKILSGRTTGYAEKFYVDGSGNLWAGSSLTANAYAGTSGAAVFGVVTATTGAAYGVRGQSASVSGVGVFGYGTSPTGLTYGVLGSNLSASGTGLSGSASSASGVTIGVRAVVQSPNGTAAIFDNLGGGKLISARTTGYAEKFSVSGAGNVTAAGAVSGTGGSFSGSNETQILSVAQSGGGMGLSASGYIGVYGGGYYGVWGHGNGYGLYGSTTMFGTYGVYGASYYGVYGTGQYGVYGTGSQYGVYGGGTTYGVYGTGNEYGVYGISNSTGVYGATSYGVAGIFEVPNVDAKILSGRRYGVEKFGVDGNGNVWSAGNVGVGTSTPGRELEVNGGVRLNTTTLKPTCDSTTRGTFWVTLGGDNVEDLVEVCTKDAANAYAWRNVI